MFYFFFREGGVMCKDDTKCCPKINSNELYPGGVDEKHFLLLVSIAPIYSVNVYKSLRAYFVEGRSRRYICDNYKINNGYLTVSINKINNLHRSLIRILRYYV
ncbi:PapB/FocB family fimbrial expression transcriptional regulator [Escherichia coli]|nr:transcriptional regulator [Escherichia coli]